MKTVPIHWRLKVLTSQRLGLRRIVEGDFTNAANVQQSLDQIRGALLDVRNFGQSIANDLSVVQFRRDFTEQTINTLQVWCG